eukprot:SAG31_NODE_16380_length_711_cov_1.184641_1_plen_66_part_01
MTRVHNERMCWPRDCPARTILASPGALIVPNHVSKGLLAKQASMNQSVILKLWSLRTVGDDVPESC